MIGIVWKENRGNGRFGIGGVKVFADKTFAPASQHTVFEFDVLGLGCKIGCEEGIGFFA